MIVDTILDYKPRQLSIDELLAEIEAENRDAAPPVVVAGGQQGAPKSLDRVRAPEWPAAGHGGGARGL